MSHAQLRYWHDAHEWLAVGERNAGRDPKKQGPELWKPKPKRLVSEYRQIVRDIITREA